jgi:hypothetical protein
MDGRDAREDCQPPASGFTARAGRDWARFFALRATKFVKVVCATCGTATSLPSPAVSKNPETHCTCRLPRPLAGSRNLGKPFKPNSSSFALPSLLRKSKVKSWHAAVYGCICCIMTPRKNAQSVNAELSIVHLKNCLVNLPPTLVSLLVNVNTVCLAFA